MVCFSSGFFSTSGLPALVTKVSRNASTALSRAASIRIVTAIVELGLPGGWRVLDILVGLLLTIGGVVMLKNSTLSGAMLAVLVTMVVGLGWMMEGVMALVESWRMPSSAWAVIYALISIVAGCVMLFSPLASTGWLILFGGCALVALGIVAIVRAFTFGKVGKSGKKR